MLKLFTILAAFALVFAGDHDFERRLKRLSERSSEDLPEQLLQVARRDSGGHFCCKKKPIDIVQVSKAVARQAVVKQKVKAGTESCGLWGTKKCDIYDFEYKQVTVYAAEFSHVSKEGSCPQHNISCCNGYFYIKGLGRCVLLSELDEILKAIEEAEEIAAKEREGNV